MAVSENERDSLEQTPEEDPSPPKSTRVRRMKACKQCHSLKVRCTPVDINDPNSPCVRCTNSNKKCEIDIDQPRKRRKKMSKRESESIGELQDQIADLQRQLQSARDGSHKDGPNSSTNTPFDSTYSHLGEAGSPPFISKIDLEREMSYLCEDNIELGDILADIRSCADRRRELLQAEANDVVSLGVITITEARHRLKLYREKLYAAHPLIEIPDNVLAEQLLKEQPFLFNTIMSISSMVLEGPYNRDTNFALENHAVDKVVKEVMVAGTKNVELLKSLILLSIWYNSPEFFKLRRYHILNNVAVTLLHDLGIGNKPLFNYSSETKLIEKSEEECKSLEYRSLILILYFSTVSICLILRRNIFVKWTPYVNESCDMLEKSGVERYKLLAVFLRLTHELDRIHHIVHTPEADETPPKLTKYALAEFQTNLSIIKSNLKPEDHQHRAFYYSVEAYLHQPIINSIQMAQSSPDGCVQKLDSETLSGIAHCTASCLFALDEFNQLLINEIAGLPLMYSSRIIYTAGILMRLRYLIMSLPSHIEKELVPRYAITAILKVNKQVQVASKQFPGNNFLKKMRLILLLFIQTYVTQVMDLLKKKDDSTPHNFKPMPLSNTSRKDLAQVASTLCKQSDTGSIITGSGLLYPPALHLDLLSFAAAAFRQNGVGKEEEKDDDSKEVLKESSQEALDDPKHLNIPLQTFRRLLNLSLLPPPPSMGGQQGPDGAYLMGDKISHNVSALKFYNFPRPSIAPLNSFGHGATPASQETYATFAPPFTSQTGTSPLPNMEFVNRDSSVFEIDDEFWSNLLSADSNKFHFAQNEPAHTESMLFMN